MFKRHKKMFFARTLEQRRHHYEVEKEIADRLRNSSREERMELMKTMYDELFARVPNHPRLTARQDFERGKKAVSEQMRLLKHWVKPSYCYLEFGPGNCSLSIAVCSIAKTVYAADIAENVSPDIQRPKNFNFLVYDGYNLDLPDNSIDVVFSNQMLEHLHPDDTTDHFRLVYRLLKPNGVYVFNTPQKLFGPCDISRGFSDVAQGFHLKEWTFKELNDLVKNLGFSQWQGYWYAYNICLSMPKWLIFIFERLISHWLVKNRRQFGRFLLPTVCMAVQK